LQQIGKVLWWDDRDGNGVITDSGGNKYYFDTSVLCTPIKGKIEAGAVVRFEKNDEINDTLCARQVTLANMKEKSRLQRELERSRQLELFA
jgi:cold shock CspA family protein